jgi:hypothetical protein
MPKIVAIKPGGQIEFLTLDKGIWQKCQDGDPEELKLRMYGPLVIKT